jgi:class 3 adenylate cyclase
MSSMDASLHADAPHWTPHGPVQCEMRASPLAPGAAGGDTSLPMGEGARACPVCTTENPAGARFCMACGTALERRCPSCGTVAPGEARYCMTCGSVIDAPAPAAAAPPAPEAPPPPLPRGPALMPEERRRVTVLFADLSGYTAAAERMDPEAVKSMIDRCLRRLGQEIVAVGGTIDKYIGDNIMALFGAPVSHEDDAERAVRAALAMQAAMPEINAGMEASFELRVGVNTGEVMAGKVGDSYTVMGDAVNVASRLQAAGRPGSVTVGEQTHLATRDVVEYTPLEPLELKGKTEPVPAWEATSMVAHRPARRVAARESPLIGREDELGLLTSLFERVVREQRPHLVTVLGEAGVGKSRLTQEFTLAVGHSPEPATVRVGRCLAYGAGIVYWALGEVIRDECAITDDDRSDVAWGKLLSTTDALLSAHPDEQEEPSERRAAMIARLLGIETPPGVAMIEGEPERMREAYFSAIRAFVEAMTRRGPVVLVFEDIHWADSGMLDLIEYVAQWIRGPLLLLCLARDELLDRRRGWGGGRVNASTVVLEPLDHNDTAALVAALLAEIEGGSVMGTAVAERSGGNPFFVEEMVRRLSEERSADVSLLPDSVQAVLAARLDSLDAFERQLVQQAAVVGRTFWLGALAEVAQREGRDLAPALASLQEKDILVPSGGAQLAGERELAFKHVLIRDVAYGTLPKAVRCTRHLEVAEFIENRVGDRADEFVTLLAEHYERAALLGEEVGLDAADLESIQRRAVSVLEAAGDAAASVFSNHEAFDRYEAARSLRCITQAGVLSRIAEKQGDVALRLGRAAAAIELWEPALEHHLERRALAPAGDLHRRIGSAFWHRGETRKAIEHYQQGINLLKEEPPHLELVALYEDAATVYMHAGDNMLAIYAAEKALRLAEQLGETRAAARAHGIFGRIFGRIGDVARARENLERSVELAREADPAESIRALLTLGSHLEIAEADYTRAGESYSEALAMAQRLGDAPSQVELQAALGVLAAYRADWEALSSFTDASADLAEREGLVGKLAYPYALRGLLAWRDGDLAAAAKHFARSHELAVQVGWSEVAFWALYGLALTRRDQAEFAEAAEALDQALEVCERAGLAAQGIQALGAKAVTLTLWGRTDEAQATAKDAVTRAEGLQYPIADAAALEARGATAEDPAEADDLLAQARTRWNELGRPLDAARCDVVASVVLAQADPDAARAAGESAASAFARYGVSHLSTGSVAAERADAT